MAVKHCFLLVFVMKPVAQVAQVSAVTVVVAQLEIEAELTRVVQVLADKKWVAPHSVQVVVVVVPE